MLRLEGGSKKSIILLHEIYGLNDHIRQYAEHFFRTGYDILCPNFIHKEKAFTYDDEQAAYTHFINQIGFDQASEEISSLIKQESVHYEEIHVVGFSIGATVAWLCSRMKEVTTVSGVYGSRIRDALNIEPACPVLLVYGEEEKSFDVKKLAASLTAENIFVHIVEGCHGFAVPYGPAYHEQSYKTTLSLIHSFIQREKKVITYDDFQID